MLSLTPLINSQKYPFPFYKLDTPNTLQFSRKSMKTVSVVAGTKCVLKEQQNYSC